MSKDISLFKDNPLASSDLFKSLQGMNDKLLGGEGMWRRISIKGGKFRQMINGEQTSVSKDDKMNIVIVGVASVARTYYAGQYDPNSEPTAPVCWSADTETPHPDVEAPQASRCHDCPQNIKGSGQGNSRACRYSQRLAVVLEGDLSKVYQLQIPATSIFGEAKENAMPMQGYARLLKAHETPVIAVVTEMRFDEDSEVPKLFFRPVRSLEKEELNTVVGLMDSQEVKDALDFTVSQTDKVQPALEKSTEPDEEKVKELFPDAKKEEVKEPEKVVKKTAEAPPEEEDLSDLVSGWDDE